MIVDLRQVVALARLEIVGIVGGCDFDCAGAEFGLREFVGDDGDLAAHQRQQNFFAVKMGVALVFSVHRNGGVAEHGFSGRVVADGDELSSPDYGIANLPEFSGDILVLHFDDRRWRSRTGDTS